MSINPKRGDVWFVQLDPVIGREQAKKRPCVIVSANSFNSSKLELAIIIPLTSKKRGFSTHIQISPPEGGILTTSYLMCEQIRSVSLDRFSAKSIGKITPKTLKTIEEIVKILLDFSKI